MHENFLLAALEQAYKGRGFCAPNPSVGAVAVKNDEIVAQAMHYGAGTAHAEQLIIEQLDGDATGVTLYVTLEPCNHQGKTPPCVDILINAKFEQVVFAYRDPNPLVSTNDTPTLLREAGIKVLHYTLPEIDAFYESYRHWLKTKTPWVTAKIAQTLDGKIAGPGGRQVSLSNPSCAKYTHQMRLQSDIILTTCRTINADDPLFNVRLAGCETKKQLAIIDTHLKLKEDAQIFSSAEHCHIFYDAQHEAPEVKANCTYYPMPGNNEGLDLKKVLTHLGVLGFHDVWVEAGGNLFTSLHQAQLVHRTYVYLVPKVLGDGATPAYQQIDIFDRANHISWRAMDDNMIATLDWQRIQLDGSCSLV